jgi:hypothetical protein
MALLVDVGALTKSFILDEFDIEGRTVKLWVEIDDNGRIVAREHGVFDVKTTRSGEIGPCDDIGRTPGMSALATLIQKEMRIQRERVIQTRKRRHAKLMESSDDVKDRQ